MFIIMTYTERGDRRLGEFYVNTDHIVMVENGLTSAEVKLIMSNGSVVLIDDTIENVVTRLNTV